mmetsp:Transcript_5418/g.8329  ORF Transcript_5418/g.8329 Transcript_5418/m.8329 type:complete len:148 (+) Transcript_5418:80-523(+)
MIIPIKVPKGGDEVSSSSVEKIEWVMLELNGELVKPQHEAVRKTITETEQNEIDKRRVEFGSVQFDDAGAPTLIIGNHELKGTSITLKNPFAVLRKRKATQLNAAADDDDGSDANSKIMKRSGVEYEVAGIVKKKLMFDKYPKSIMR